MPNWSLLAHIFRYERCATWVWEQSNFSLIFAYPSSVFFVCPTGQSFGQKWRYRQLHILDVLHDEQ